MIRILKEKLKIFYKTIIIKIFSFFYSKPLMKKKGHKDKSSQEIKVNINKNIYKIYKFENGTIFTDSNDTTAYISKNNFLSEASMQYYKFDKINSYNATISKNPTLKFGTPKIKKIFRGNVLSLLSGGAAKDNFTHWFTDVIPRLKIYSEKFSLNKIDKFYIPSLKYKYQKDSLKILKIKKNKILTSEDFKHIKADNIYATSHPCFYLPTKVKKWSLDYLNKKFFIKANIRKFKKIFVDRDQLKLINLKNLKNYKSYKFLINEKEIKNHLFSKGFTIIKPEDYTLREQIKIFSSADYVVGLYGAAMMMLTFCKKKTKVIELKPLLAGNEFKNISKLRKLIHRQINIKPLYKSSTPQNGLLFCSLKKIDRELNLIKKI